MIKMQNKETLIKISNGKEEKNLLYSDLINLLCSSTNLEGDTLDEVCTKLDIKDICISDKRVLEFTKEQFELIQKIVKEYKWKFIHKDLRTFKQDLGI